MILKPVLRSRSRKESPLLVGAGAHLAHIFSHINLQNQKKKIVSTGVLIVDSFEIFALQYSRVGAGAAGSGGASKFTSGAGAG
jgi:hypothetical protein